MLTDGTGLAVAVLVGFATAQFGTFATTVYLHRTVTHRAMTMRPGLAFVFRVVVWMTSGQAPRQWAAVHRKHHAYSDVEGDPHSPVLLGWKHVQLHNVRLYRRVAQDDEQVRRYARDVRPDRWDRWLFDRGVLGLGITVVLLVAVLGPVAGLLAFAVHVVSYVQLNASINALTHTFGTRPYDNRATNLRVLALFTAGEGLHNNHHAAPTSARFSMGRFQFDPAWWSIRMFRRFGWVTVRRAGPPPSRERRPRIRSASAGEPVPA